MSATLTTEQVEEILAGCEYVTPGPWRYEVQPFGSAIAKDDRCIATTHYNLAIIGTKLPHAENAAHIARLDPQTVSSLATELLALRKRVGELEGAIGDTVEIAGSPASRKAMLAYYRRMVELYEAYK